MKQHFKRYFLYARLIFWVAVPVVLLALPSNFFDDGPVMCMSRLLFNLECWGCGITRGVMHFIHFEFTEAYYYNALSFIVAPMLAYQWLMWAWKDVKIWQAQRRQTASF